MGLMVAGVREYLVSHGKTGVLGRFVAVCAESLQRGDRVIIEGDRGISFGVVLCEASDRQSRLLGPVTAGKLLRRASSGDDSAHAEMRSREQTLFESARRLVGELETPIEIVDVELALDGRRLILQCLAAAGADAGLLPERLAAEHGVDVWLENLAAPATQEEAGCGKPDCGRLAGGCSDCSTGGCSSCGSGGVDLRQYFGHLREKMDARRIPLV
jgi:hypothetical protein